ncbi:magnesium transporter [Thermosediminibacter oceani]|uniref:Magnesium transporter MgtE n=1 Tax=Thermosediminibacter oceani (strain ATCC BAA-1034 / DSM 16646 / JW/IW-1228P) TaxID=555079 RepID=D9S2J3_THEOJ|nr:magnesium transporter [Thermosediminibacter oceani]ADL07620.1 magnesium transporter [Thermosediminibacter oceani DSM 16646]
MALHFHVDEIRELIQKGDYTGLSKMLKDSHPVDIAELFGELEPQEYLNVFKHLEFSTARDVLEELDQEKITFILTNIKPKYAALLIREMSSDEVADYLGMLPEGARQNFLHLLKQQDQKDIRALLSYPETSAGGRMTTDFIAFPKDMNAQEALNKLAELAPDAEMIYYVYVVDHEGKLIGVLSLRDLVLSAPDTTLDRIMYTDVKKVLASQDQEEVTRLMEKYGFLALPVVDEEGVLLGIITVDDVMDVVEEEATEDILKMAGTEEEIDPEKSSPWYRARRRLPWILVALFGEIVSGNVIKNFSEALQALVALSFFIPLLMDMGGDVGTQSAAIVVRGLATGEIEPWDIWKNLLREIRVGVVLGIINGAIVGSIAYIWQGMPALGLVVGISMVLNLTIAAFLGTFMPLMWNKLGRDPAVTSGPFVTTLLDIIGLFVYFSTARWILKL